MNIDWYTPKTIIDSLGRFDLDPATSPEAIKMNCSAMSFYTREDDGLMQKWHGRIWLNPPYSNPLLQLFLKKMALHNRGIALIFSKVEAKWFHDIVFEYATAIKFLYDRIKFHKPDGTTGNQPRHGSMLVAYGNRDAEILAVNTLKGTYIRLKNN